MQNKIIERPVFALMLINGHEGVLSLGGTAAPAVDLVVKQTKEQLDRMGALERGEIASITTQNGDTVPKGRRIRATITPFILVSRRSVYVFWLRYFSRLGKLIS